MLLSWSIFTQPLWGVFKKQVKHFDCQRTNVKLGMLSPSMVDRSR
jgi:hypothetical protein